jgi:4-hydroxyphenylpyruvate dioxygenase
VLLQSPCGGFWLQLVEPEGFAAFASSEEHLSRVGLSTPDVIGAVKLLQKRGIEFLATGIVHTTERGALTAAAAGGVIFELVHTTEPAAANDGQHNLLPPALP